MKTISSLLKRNAHLVCYLGATVILLGILLTIISVISMRNLRTAYSFDQFQPNGHAALEIKEKHQRDFRLETSTPYILKLELNEGESWLEESKVLLLGKLTQSIEAIDGVHSVMSLANVQTALIKDDQFMVGTTQDLLSQQWDLRQLQNNDLVRPNLISHHLNTTALIITPTDISVEQQLRLMDLIKAKSFHFFPKTKTELGGPTAIKATMADLLGEEIGLFLVLSLLSSLALLFFVFKGESALIAPALLIISGNVIGLGAMAYFGFPFTVLSTTLPILITITIVSISTHTMVRLCEFPYTTDFNKKCRQLYKTMCELTGPHLLTATTTAVGFATLIPSDVPVIKDYGLSVAVAIPAACIYTIVMLPAIMLFLRTPQLRESQLSFSGFYKMLLTHAAPIVSVLFVAMLIASAVGQQLSWTGRLYDDLPKTQQVRTITESIDKNLGGTVPFSAVITMQKDSWKTPRNISVLGDLTTQWRNVSQVGSVISLSDFMKMTTKEQRLPASQPALAEAQFLYGMSVDNPLAHYLSSDQTSTRVQFRMKDLPANEMNLFTHKVEAQLKTAFPESTVHLSGPALAFHQMGQTVSKQLMFGFFPALGLIALILAIVFRSVRWSLLACIPNFVPPIVLFAGLALSNTPIKPSIALIFAIALGIAFDNTIYILGRLNTMLKEGKHDSLPLLHLMTHESKACLVSSASLFFGFSIFLFSYFEMNQLFGLFMILALFAGIVGDLIFLPCILKLFPQLLRYNKLTSHRTPLISTEVLSMAGRVALFTLLVTPMIFVSSPLGAESNSANKILLRVQKLTSPPQEVAKLSMQIIEKNGSVTDRSLTIKRKNGKQQKALVKLTGPVDLKGVSLLTISEGDEESQWLYLPSSGRSRRIVGSNKKGRFLDSDLAYEDLSIATYNQFKNNVAKVYKVKGQKIVLIESLPKTQSDSSYGKIRTWVNLKYHRIEKAEYYDKANKLVKKMDFDGYRRVGGKYWRAKKLIVTDVTTERRTILTLKDVELAKLSDGEFSISALEEG